MMYIEHVDNHKRMTGRQQVHGILSSYYVTSAVKVTFTHGILNDHWR